MITHLLRHPYGGLVILSILSVIGSCRAPVSTTTSSLPTPSTTPVAVKPSSSQDAPAIVRDIPEHPVWLKLVNASEEIPAQEGIGLRQGEKLRTQGSGLAQLELKNGSALRLGGDAAFTLQGNSRYELSKGEMLLWSEPKQQVPVEIVLPGAVVRAQKTTLSVKIPTSPEDDVELLAWEGAATVQLPNISEPVQLNAGEVVKWKPNKADLQEVQASVRSLTGPEWLERRFQNRLLDGFDKPLPTLVQVERAAPSKVDVAAVVSARTTQSKSTPIVKPFRSANRPPRPLKPTPALKVNSQAQSQVPTSVPKLSRSNSVPPRPLVTPSPVRLEVSNPPVEAVLTPPSPLSSPSPPSSPSPDGGRFAEFNPYLSNSQRQPKPEQLQNFCDRFPLNSRCAKKE